MPELHLCCALLCSHSRVFCALPCCLLLLQLCLLLNHLRSSAFSPFSTGFCHFRNFHTSLSPIFHTSRSPFLFSINACDFSSCLSFLLPDEASGRNVVNSTVCCSTLVSLFQLLYVNTFVLNKCRNFFCVAHFCAAILVFSARFGAVSCCCNFGLCSTTYVRPLSHLSPLAFVNFFIFHTSLSLIFHTSLSPFFFINSCAIS